MTNKTETQTTETEGLLNELHKDALDRLPVGEWMRLRQFTDRPEVARDLCAYGYLKTKKEPIGHNGEIVYYARKS